MIYMPLFQTLSILRLTYVVQIDLTKLPQTVLKYFGKHLICIQRWRRSNLKCEIRHRGVIYNTRSAIFSFYRITGWIHQSIDFRSMQMPSVCKCSRLAFEYWTWNKNKKTRTMQPKKRRPVIRNPKYLRRLQSPRCTNQKGIN